MTLNDIYKVVNESTRLEVYHDGKLLALYDGRESIPSKYNTRKILQIFPNYESLSIELEDE